jgi:hypothetical protein
MTKQARENCWQQLVAQVCREYAHLEAREKSWITRHCRLIGSRQEKLNQLFILARGETVCRHCRGDCCALGHNHLTLANLLALHGAGQPLPQPDFSKTCPLLTPHGCQLAATYRPYNCISFVCERIEAQLNPQQLAEFYQIEKELRQLYRSFQQRYTGASLSGLLIAAARLQGGPFLHRTQSSLTAESGVENGTSL